MRYDRRVKVESISNDWTHLSLVFTLAVREENELKSRVVYLKKLLPYGKLIGVLYEKSA